MIDFGKMRGAFETGREDLPADVREALDEWMALPAVEDGKPYFFVRCVAVDVATGGLRPGVDPLLGVAAVGVAKGAVGSADVCAFDVTAGTDRDAIARHLVGLLRHIGKAPVVTFQAAFVDAFLRRAFTEYLGLDFSPSWIDLAWALPELFASVGDGRATLDDWLRRFSIDLPGRQEALSDAVAIARLLLVAQAEASRRGIDTPRKLREIEATRRWLGRES